LILSGGLLVKNILFKYNALQIFAFIFLNCFFDFLYFFENRVSEKNKIQIIAIE